MRKLKFIIIIIFLANNCKGQQRPPIDLGQGAVSIGFFWFPPADTEKMDTSRHEFIQYSYHINHDKILKSGDVDVPTTQSDKKQMINDTDTLHTHLSVSMISSTYLIDWNKRLVYTFYKKNKRTYISLDSLNKYTDDICYRLISNALVTNVKFVFDTSNQIKTRVAGIDCYQARYKSTQNEGWRQFTYTKKQLSFYPPLNCLFNNTFPYPVMSFDYESRNDSYPDKQKRIALVRLEIIYLNEKQQYSYLFKVPPDIPIRKNVSKQEMYDNNSK